MKSKHILVSFLALILILTPSLVNAQEFLEHRLNITMAVQCMDEALTQMSDLPGFEMSSHMDIANGIGHALRLVDARDIERVLNLLGEMGTITNSDSRADNNFSSWSAIRAEITIRNHEYTRLMELLYEATTMDEFNQIEHRLRQVIADMERLRGQLNSVEGRLATAQINISLFEVAEDWVYEPETVGRLRRIGDAFVNSFSATLNGAQALAVFLAHVSLPVVLIAAVTAIVLVIRRAKRKEASHEKN